MKTKRILAGIIIPLILAAVSGCASHPTFRDFFEDHRSGLPVIDQGLLLETLRVIALLEDYCSALEGKDREKLRACYSPRYSHYEHGLEWRMSRVEESYFLPFGRLEARFGPVSLEFVRKYSGYWMRQEEFDWLRSPRGERSPLRSYRITLPAGSGPVELFLVEPAATEQSSGREYSPPRFPAKKEEKKFGGGPLPIEVSSLVDPGVERTLGEVAFPLTIRGSLRAGGDPGEFVSTIRERVVFLLEKEDGEWKIISQF